MCIMFMLSPGFYELSDGGSCSLSNSCTSVYSECLSSSQTSLLLLPLNPANSQINPPSQVDVCRRRSADEGTTQPNPPRATGFHLGSSRIRASTTGSEQARPRPVSTGNYFTDPRLRNYSVTAAIRITIEIESMGSLFVFDKIKIKIKL